MSLMRYSEKELIYRAILNAKPRTPGANVPLWAAVEESFGLGSTLSAELCRVHGFDPDKRVSAPVCERCSEEFAQIPSSEAK